MNKMGCIFGMVFMVMLFLLVAGVILDIANAEEPQDWISPVMEPVEMPYRNFVPRGGR
jgi:uncharacterized protein YggT (Ycf19 family)